MFYLRGALVCVSVFVLVYVCASVGVGRWWRAVARRRSANGLFALRMTPVVSALLVVAALAIPSFIRYEPRGAEEGLGAIPLVMAAVFLVLAIQGASRAWMAVRRTGDCVRRWTYEAGDAEVAGAVVVDSPDAPAVALAGVTNTTMLISAAAHSALTPAELRRAIAHEMSHRRASDNLKKLLLRAFAFPGMAQLERAWLEAIELSADHQAVHSPAEALDLASALVKISRIDCAQELPPLASGLADGPQSSLELRVQRLLHWTAEGPRSNAARRLIMFSVVAFAGVACNYAALLHAMHGATELLVR